MSKILAIDIGNGTTDIILYDSSKNIENSIKIVMPTPSRRYLQELEAIDFTGSQKILIHGSTIGGGPLAHELIHIAREGKASVTMTRNAAFTIRNDMDEVASFGIKIIDEPDLMGIVPSGRQSHDSNVVVNSEDIFMIFQELEFPFLSSFFERLGEDLSLLDGICVCAQDHGICKKEISDRLNRFSEFEKILKRGGTSPAGTRPEDERPARKNAGASAGSDAHMPTPYSFCFDKNTIPEKFYRLKSLASRISSFLPSCPMLIMDSSPAALLGCFAYAEEYRELNKKKLREPYLMVNMGNNHAIFVVAREEKILAFYEHHTWAYEEDPEKLEKHIKRFCDGELPSSEIFDDEGNGSLYFDPPGFDKIKNIIVTGPNRDIFRKTSLKVHYASLGGDMMMTGPLGMVRAFKKIHEGETGK